LGKPPCFAPSSIPPCKNIPLYRISEISYVSPIPAHPRGAIFCRHVSRAGLAVDAAASGARGQGQGGLLSVSPKLRADERRCQVRLASILPATSTTSEDNAANKRAVRTAKPCGPGRRRYGQALAEVEAGSTGQAFASLREVREARRNSAPVRARHKPSTHCAGKAVCLASPVCCCAVFLRYLSRSRPRVPAGTRPSLRPLGLSRVERRSNARVI